MTCNPDFIANCKTDQIKEFLDDVYITQYFLTEKVDFVDNDKIQQGKRPIHSTIEMFK